jgi:hypothetical protein
MVDIVLAHAYVGREVGAAEVVLRYDGLAKTKHIVNKPPPSHL